MKNMRYSKYFGAHSLRRIFSIAVLGVVGVIGMSAQNSLPAPGTGGSYNPAPVGGNNGIGWNPGPGFNGGPGGPGAMGPGSMGPGWGNNGIGWNPGPGWNGPINNPAFVNQGTVNVIACGYDAQGIWRTLPLHVAYTYNGVEYDVTVLNAWNPWTKTWNVGVDMPAYNTSYYLRGQTYNFYAPLSTGTYYFNL